MYKNIYKETCKVKQKAIIIHQNHNISLKHYYMFCPQCHKLSLIPNFAKLSRNYNFACDNCGYVTNKNNIDIFMHTSDLISSSKYLNITIPSAKTINCNDGANNILGLKDINTTILYKTYTYDFNTLKPMGVFSYYTRYTYNFNNKQLYYIKSNVKHPLKPCDKRRPLKGKNDKYINAKIEMQYVNVLDMTWTYLTEHDALNRHALQIIFDEYNQKYNQKLVLPTVNEILSLCPMKIFMYMKYPIVTSFIIPNIQKFKEDIQRYFFQIIYYACHYDRKLNNLFMIASIDEYYIALEKMFSKYIDWFTYKDDLYSDPFFVIYAQYLTQYHFHNLKNIKIISDHMKYSIQMNKKCSLWLHDLIQKRTHIRKKVFNKMLKIMSESNFTLSLIESENKSQYDEFYNYVDLLRGFWLYVDFHYADMIFNTTIDDLLCIYQDEIEHK